MATDADNEPTGVHFSDGDSSIAGLIGGKIPNTRQGRLFFTQQHGENNLFEVKALTPGDSAGE